MDLKKILADVQSPYLKTGVPDFRPGDTLRVHVKVVEGESERIQPFEGLVIGRQGGGLGETFTVRKISFGIGIERTFPVHAPRIVKIELVKSGKIRRAKLFYLRELTGKAARLTEKEEKELMDAQAPSAQPAAETPKPEQPKKNNPQPATV